MQFIAEYLNEAKSVHWRTHRFPNRLKARSHSALRLRERRYALLTALPKSSEFRLWERSRAFPSVTALFVNATYKLHVLDFGRVAARRAANGSPSGERLTARCVNAA